MMKVLGHRGVTVCLIVICMITVLCGRNKKPKIVVIGAGLAGLTTAYRLHQKGVNVEVYEARNRVGGRIFSVSIAGKIAELGGQNINDGGNAEHVWGLIKEFGLEETEEKITCEQIYFDGKGFIAFRQLMAAEKLDLSSLKRKMENGGLAFGNMRDVLCEIAQESGSFYKALAVRLAVYEGETIERLSSCYIKTLLCILIGSGTLSIPSLMGENEKEEHSLVSINGGNALLPIKIADALFGHVHNGMPLMSMARNLDQSYTLTFQSGERITADMVVLAIPCSVYDTLVFAEGVMPLAKLEAIKNVSYGTNAKIIVPFSAPHLKAMVLSNDRLASWFTHDGSLLTLYYAGNAGRFCPYTIFNVYNDTLTMLEKAFGQLSYCLPSYAEDQHFILYDSPVGYSWPHDPYSRGSYAYISPGQENLLTALHEECGEKVKTLFAPVDQRIYFAGEHASILLDFSGTMEAACESGERTARMILNQLAVVPL